MKKIVLGLLLFVCFYTNAQISLSSGKAQLVEFTNKTAKFIVPAGKTWYVNQVLSYYKLKNTDGIRVHIKSINGVELTNLALEKYGTKVYDAVNTYVIQFPLIFPENTTFELIILEKKETGPPYLSDNNAFINYVETNN